MNAPTTFTPPAPAISPLVAGAGAASHVPAQVQSGLPHPLFTPALTRVLAARVAQVERYGHTPAQDDATGAAALVAMARSKIIQIERQLLKEADQLTQQAGDMLHGNPDRIATMSDSERIALDRRLCNAGAIILAALDVLDRAA